MQEHVLVLMVKGLALAFTIMNIGSGALSGSFIPANEPHLGQPIEFCEKERNAELAAMWAEEHPIAAPVCRYEWSWRPLGEVRTIPTSNGHFITIAKVRIFGLDYGIDGYTYFNDEVVVGTSI